MSDVKRFPNWAIQEEIVIKSVPPEVSVSCDQARICGHFDRGCLIQE